MGEELINFKDSWIVKYVFNNNIKRLTKIHRFDDSLLLQDAYRASEGQAIDISKYGNEEQNFALCWTNEAVNIINEKWNNYYAKTKDKIKTVVGFKQSKIILYIGLTLLAYTSNKSQGYFNSDEFVVEDFNDEYIYIYIYIYS